jgi:hypothetical protein
VENTSGIKAGATLTASNVVSIPIPNASFSAATSSSSASLATAVIPKINPAAASVPIATATSNALTSSAPVPEIASDTNASLPTFGGVRLSMAPTPKEKDALVAAFEKMAGDPTSSAPVTDADAEKAIADLDFLLSSLM